MVGRNASTCLHEYTRRSAWLGVLCGCDVFRDAFEEMENLCWSRVLAYIQAPKFRYSTHANHAENKSGSTRDHLLIDSHNPETARAGEFAVMERSIC